MKKTRIYLFLCIFVFIYQSVAFSLGPAIEDAVACLKSASLDQQTVLINSQTNGKASMFYLGQSGAFRVTSPLYFNSREISYYFMNNNKDTGSDGVCMRCTKGKCILATDWKKTPKDFPSDCDDIKRTVGFRKVEVADSRNNGTQPGELGISEFVSVAILQMESPKNLAEARQFKDHLNTIKNGCKALVDGHRSMDLKNGYGDDIVDALEARASELKKDFKISVWPESASNDNKKTSEISATGSQ